MFRILILIFILLCCSAPTLFNLLSCWSLLRDWGLAVPHAGWPLTSGRTQGIGILTHGPLLLRRSARSVTSSWKDGAPLTWWWTTWATCERLLLKWFFGLAGKLGSDACWYRIPVRKCSHTVLQHRAAVRLKNDFCTNGSRTGSLTYEQRKSELPPAPVLLSVTQIKTSCLTSESFIIHRPLHFQSSRRQSDSGHLDKQEVKSRFSSQFTSDEHQQLPIHH